MSSCQLNWELEKFVLIHVIQIEDISDNFFPRYRFCVTTGHVFYFFLFSFLATLADFVFARYSRLVAQVLASLSNLSFILNSYLLQTMIKVFVLILTSRPNLTFC